MPSSACGDDLEVEPCGARAAREALRASRGCRSRAPSAVARSLREDSACAAISCSMPRAASASSASSSLRCSAWPSAVPWISTNPPRVVHHDVHVGFGLGVLGVVEVEDRHALRRCRPTPPRPDRGSDCARSCAPSTSCSRGERERDVAAGDRRGARAAVGLQHVAVDRDRVLAERRRDRRPRAGCGRSAAGSRACGRLACRVRPRAACACASRAAACRTRR